MATTVTRIFGLGPRIFFFVPNEFNCIKIDNKAIFLLQRFFTSELCRQTKWYAFELNSKFDKTENFIQKSYHNLMSKEVDCLYV